MTFKSSKEKIWYSASAFSEVQKGFWKAFTVRLLEAWMCFIGSATAISQANRLESLKSIRADLHRKLQPIRTQLEDINISEDERSQSIDDFHTLDAILEALEEQHIRIVLMGKVNAGKSSLANSLLQADVYKTDAIQGTAIKANGTIKLDKWEIHDTPGIMNNLAVDFDVFCSLRLFLSFWHLSLAP